MADSGLYGGAELEVVRGSGLFLADWYLARHKELAVSGLDALEYYCRRGWARGDLPNPYFDPAYYLRMNEDVARAGVNPLLHYVLHGDSEGRDPCGFFDTKWYRAHYAVPLEELTLRHFLTRRASGEVAPVPMFDPAWYFEQNPDVATAGSDPFEHFLSFGVVELRDPAPDFDMGFYIARYGAVLSGQNPLLHYLANRDRGTFVPARPEHEKLIPGAVKRATRPAPTFEEFRPVPANAPRRAKVLAYYLPQFHAIPENDAWWGKGFTDWTNLSRALPRFAGHLQPRVPRDLGFYTLDDGSVLRRQIELAAGGGLHGFVFYFYWFNGKRLLENPLHHLLADKTLVFPFCVMWANENWTRRWDGLEREVLLAQEYRPADDAALVACFAAMFADARYIRLDGRPLLMIYRAALIPDAARRIAAWRRMFQAAHGENPIIVMAQSLGDHDPRPYGLDGAVEFPPHRMSDELPKLNATLDLFDPEFSAAVYDYETVAAASAAAVETKFPLIKTAAPGWDNDPRREGKGLVLHGSTPAKYQAWLEDLLTKAGENKFFGEPVVAVNAWNEWAEGAFLEPDIHFGAAYLNATGRAICGAVRDGKAGLLLVGHDAQPHGAQLLLLHLARHYARVWGFEVHVLLLGAGPLVEQFQKTATVTLTNDKAAIANALNRYAAIGLRRAVVNSAAAARLVPALAERGLAVTLLVHEMPKLLAEYNLQMQAKLGALAATKVVFASDFGRRIFCEALQITLPDAVILPQGNYRDVAFSQAARAAARHQLGIDDTAFLMLGVGFADLRKGFDLFVQIARRVLASRDDVHFLWVGEVQPGIKTYLADEIAAAKATGRFHLIGYTEDVAPYFSAADVYALTSREDPYPTVALEALAAGVPVVAFEGSGGIPALLRAHRAGGVAASGDADAFRKTLLRLCDHEKRRSQRVRLVALAAARFSQAYYARKLLLNADPQLRTVSACVLNYNYARYLRPRLQDVFAQDYPVCETLFFDDASTDESAALAAHVAEKSGRAMTMIGNAKNSGAVFSQWRRAAAQATGEFIWLAEADDGSAPAFLSRVVEAMGDDAVLGFADSQVIDAAGRMIAPDYQAQYRAAGLEKSATWPARRFAGNCLAVQNLLFNASAVVWRRTALLAALARCGKSLDDWRLAGDWRLYLEALARNAGTVAYVAAPLNRHRRHAASVTATLDAAQHIDEIRAMQALAAERLALGPAEIAAQAAYLKHIKDQFSGQGQKIARRAKPRRSNVASEPKVRLYKS